MRAEDGLRGGRENDVSLLEVVDVVEAQVYVGLGELLGGLGTRKRVGGGQFLEFHPIALCRGRRASG